MRPAVEYNGRERRQRRGRREGRGLERPPQVERDGAGQGEVGDHQASVQAAEHRHELLAQDGTLYYQVLEGHSHEKARPRGGFQVGDQPEGGDEAAEDSVGWDAVHLGKVARAEQGFRVTARR